jgi:hypothetical protein
MIGGVGYSGYSDTAPDPVLRADMRPAVGDRVRRPPIPAWATRCGVYVGSGYYCDRVSGHDVTDGHVGIDSTGRVMAVDYLPASVASATDGAVTLPDRPAVSMVKADAPTAPPALDPAELAARLASMSASLDQERTRVAALREALKVQQSEVQRIRDYVVERYNDNEICRDGTAAFLREFGMEGLPRTYTLTYTVEVTDVEVTDDDDSEAESAADDVALERLQDALRHVEGVDLSDIRLSNTTETTDD